MSKSETNLKDQMQMTKTVLDVLSFGICICFVLGFCISDFLLQLRGVVGQRVSVVNVFVLYWFGSVLRDRFAARSGGRATQFHRGIAAARGSSLLNPMTELPKALRCPSPAAQRHPPVERSGGNAASPGGNGGEATGPEHCDDPLRQFRRQQHRAHDLVRARPVSIAPKGH